MTVEARARVHAPVLAVWEAWTNLPDWPAWAPGVRQVDVDWSGDPHVGGMARVHTPFGPRDFMITAVDAPASWSWRGRLGAWSVTWRHDLAERADGGADVATLAEFSGPARLIAEAVVGLALRPAMQRKLRALASLFEKGSAPDPDG
ncbi:MAG TPA: SRPBCC family protein [Egibacteraceae bacterium]|nr:SRPBCC family protein [Egibacteraceae bacterium]